MKLRQDKKSLQKMLRKKWQKKVKQNQGSVTAQGSSKGYLWAAAEKAADVTRRMRCDKCPGDPPRSRSLVNRSSGIVGTEG